MYLRRILSYSSATVAAQAIGFLFIPVIAHLFSPEDWAIYSLYLTFSATLITIASGRFDLAIPLTREANTARGLVVLSLIFTFSSVIIFTLLIAIFGEYVLSIVTHEEHSLWLWLVPLGVIAGTGFQVLTYWCTGKSNYSKLAITKISVAAGFIVFPIACLKVFALPQGICLVVGQLIATSFAVTLPNLRLCQSLFAFLRSSQCNIRFLAETAKHHGSYPKHALSTGFINALSRLSVLIVLQIFFGSIWTGFMAMAEKLVLTPLRILSTSIWQVTHASMGSLNRQQQVVIFEKVHRLVSVGYGLPLAVVGSLGHFIGLILGESWEQVGDILPAVCLMAYFNMVSNSTSYFAAFKLFRTETVVNVIIAGVSFSSILLGAFYLNPDATIILYCCALASCYFGINLFWGYNFKRVRRFTFNILMGGAAPGIYAYLLTRSESYLFITFPGLFIAAVIYLKICLVILRDLRDAVDFTSDITVSPVRAKL
jgi:O-antigen/teichoic acid export membrane protein